MPTRFCKLALLCLLLLFVMSNGGWAREASSNEESYVPVKELNTGLPVFMQVASQQLTTPERSLSYFVRQCREGRYHSAAYVLNLKDIDPAQQSESGAELARKLYLVMDRQTGFPFAALPDRADGERPPAPTSNDIIGGQPRKAYLLSSLPLEIGQFEIYLMRYRTANSEDIWLFAPTTVSRTSEAFEFCGPRSWEARLPSWLLKKTPDGTPFWAWGLLLLSMAVTVGLCRAAKMLVDKLLRHQQVEKLWGGLTLLLATWIPYFSLQWWVPIPNPILYLMLFVGFCTLIWLVSTALHDYSTQLIRGEIESVKDLDDIAHLRDKRKLTYLSVGRRLLSFLALAVGVGTVAMKTAYFESVGLSLLASAGVVSVVLGIAAQPILVNIISGVQIAISRPIRVGDAILYDDDTCYVEEITYMSVICRTWDERRLVIPLTYFVSQPFSSYSLINPQTMKIIEFYVSHSVDVDALRSEYERLAQDSPLWSKNSEPKLEVLELTERAVQIRAVATADNAASAWDLHCEIREGLLKYLQREQKSALPGLRLLNPSGSTEAFPDESTERPGAQEP